MSSYYPKADADILKPGIVVGRHPGTGVLHRLTITVDGRVIIERKPYVSDNPDGWTQHYKNITDDAENHTFLILAIRNNPAVWPK